MNNSLSLYNVYFCVPFCTDVLRLLSSGEGSSGTEHTLRPQPVSGLPVQPGVPGLLHGRSLRQPDSSTGTV